MMLSDYIAVMREGEIVQYAPAEAIYRRPQHLYVATFIGKPQMSTMEGRLRITPERISYESEDLQFVWPNAAGQPVETRDTQAILGIRAEDVQIAAGGDTPEPGGSVGTVSLLEPLGSDTYVEINRGSINVTGRVEPDRRLRVGDTVPFSLPIHKLHFFDAASGERINL